MGSLHRTLHRAEHNIEDDHLQAFFLMMLMVSNSRQECRCYNPFDGSIQSQIGDPSRNCDTKGVCFVSCDSTCSDKHPADSLFAGRGRCVSSTACSLDGGFVLDRPKVIVLGGLEVNCKENSICEQENIITFLEEKNTVNCKDSKCLQQV